MKLTPTTDPIPGLKVSNAYLVQADYGELTLIDSGMPGNAKRISDFLSARGIDPKSLTLILLTHPDLDHSGSVWELKQKYAPNARVAIHEEDAPGSPAKRSQGSQGSDWADDGNHGIVYEIPSDQA